jgi:tRNA (uracil-5-)-methyltransferase TRM9
MPITTHRMAVSPDMSHPQKAGSEEGVTGATPMMAASYDRYFSSGLYQSRYPRPNPRTLRILERVLPHGGRLLDYGAGEGRYSLALVQSRNAQVLALDISATAREVLAHRVDAADLGHAISIADPWASGVMASPDASDRYDVALLAFGVLAHIKGREERLKVLAQLRKMLTPRGRLVLGLPNVRRRFRVEQADMANGARPEGYEVGDVYYRRSSSGGYVDLFYHLFDRDEIAISRVPVTKSSI